MPNHQKWPWDSLIAPGDSFLVKDDGYAYNLRAAASKRGKRLGIVISVKRVNTTTVRVQYERGRI